MWRDCATANEQTEGRGSRQQRRFSAWCSGIIIIIIISIKCKELIMECVRRKRHTGCIMACFRGGLLRAQARACGVTVRLPMSKRKAVGADSRGASQPADLASS